MTEPNPSFPNSPSPSVERAAEGLPLPPALTRLLDSAGSLARVRNEVLQLSEVASGAVTDLGKRCTHAREQCEQILPLLDGSEAHAYMSELSRYLYRIESVAMAMTAALAALSHGVGRLAQLDPENVWANQLGSIKIRADTLRRLHEHPLAAIEKEILNERALAVLAKEGRGTP